MDLTDNEQEKAATLDDLQPDEELAYEGLDGEPADADDADDEDVADDDVTDNAPGGFSAFAEKIKHGVKDERFLKLFVIVLAIAVAAVTVGLTVFNTVVLDSKPMDKTQGGSDSVDMETPLTEDDLNILIPGSGIFATEFKDSKRVNILLLGNTDEGLSDTIMLVSFDPESKTAAIISIPRDTYYPRQGYSAGSSWNKINAVFHEGARASCEAIHDLLVGIPINYYAVCDYDGVAKIIDAMGGVPFYVPQDMYYSEPGQNLLIDLKEGEQILNGAKAVQYLRFRNGQNGTKGYFNGDIGRIEAQQSFVQAALKQAMRLDKLPAVAQTAFENVDSDITLRAMLYLVGKADEAESIETTTYLLPGTGLTISGLSFWQPADAPEIDALLRGIYDPSSLQTEEEDAEGAEGTSEGSTGEGAADGGEVTAMADESVPATDGADGATDTTDDTGDGGGAGAAEAADAGAEGAQ